MELYRFEYEDTRDLPMTEIRRRASVVASEVLDMHRYVGCWSLVLISQSNTANGRVFNFIVYEDFGGDAA